VSKVDGLDHGRLQCDYDSTAPRLVASNQHVGSLRKVAAQSNNRCNHRLAGLFFVFTTGLWKASQEHSQRTAAAVGLFVYSLDSHPEAQQKWTNSVAVLDT